MTRNADHLYASGSTDRRMSTRKSVMLICRNSDGDADADTSLPAASRAKTYPTVSEEPAMDEKDLQKTLLNELYDFNIPATDIALVVNAMRGTCSRDEEAVLLQRLYNLGVPSAYIAKLVDAMRKGKKDSGVEQVVVRNDDVIEDAPPQYA